ncbi:MAG: hypothetical protein EAZ73_17700 [Oscillatoriales cyanobacterium]|nr:MAG: hypothetical protein EAZ83_16280 [Oscillatoriales cyanobacterium]TAF18600.1 MAG: hypothetical protein EAZ73_17700 [Oscillatoriales cyanobacterium]
MTDKLRVGHRGKAVALFFLNGVTRKRPEGRGRGKKLATENLFREFSRSAFNFSQTPKSSL